MEQKTQTKDYKHIVRVGGTDIDGSKQLLYALRKIKGVGYIMGNAICTVTNIDKHKLAGYLTDEEIEQINEVLKEPAKFGIPTWVMNRRFDPETGEDAHLFGADIDFVIDSDIKRMRKIKSYKGFRHGKGLPVRGQRTRSNFRKNKGKALGVQRRKGRK
ncbi:30S ribosomal protein S13 [Candidatus Woesearchaeota archaeon]|nr:30S ribosomal protein S13 [Candidatus Woesearchaeota archaeon]RLE43693.1 MAG: 30S ribosomal protein S13 [Candidatus Woesearchaeota archaeon]